MATPYITPEILINAPTGVSWETIPDFNSNPDAQLAEQTNICWRATHWIDSYCNQPLRSTVDAEEFLGPDYRMTIDHNGLARVLTSRWPVTQVVNAQYTAAYVAPPQWQQIPTNYMFIENALDIHSGVSIESAAGPSAIRIVPGYLSWWNGRNGLRLQLTYVNGWAHAGITASVELGSTTVTVDDCTGMFNGTVGRGMWIYDGANTEYVVVAGTSVDSGPGVVTLKSPLLYSHNGSQQQPKMMSSLPASIQQAAILHATMQALERGATATTVQGMPGSTTSAGGNASHALMEDIRSILKPYRRVI